MSVLVIGSSNLDFVVRAPRIPKSGETLMGSGFATYAGGKGANQAVACTKLGIGPGGVPTSFLTSLGQDAFAEQLKSASASAGLDLHAVTSSAPTGCAFITVDDQGENAITVVSGANADLSSTHWDQLDLRGITHLLMQLETPLATVAHCAHEAHKADIHVTLNAAPASALPEALLASVDTLIVNEGEFEALLATQKVSPAKPFIADQLSAWGTRFPHQTVIVTLGAKGCVAWHKDALHTQAGFAVDVVDTTGAGDTFCGAYVASLAGGESLQSALRFACVAAALSCTKAGAQTGLPTRDDVLGLLAQ